MTDTEPEPRDHSTHDRLWARLMQWESDMEKPRIEQMYEYEDSELVEDVDGIGAYGVA